MDSESGEMNISGRNELPRILISTPNTIRSTPRPHYSPPCKPIRALRLFNSPKSPRTIIGEDNLKHGITGVNLFGVSRKNKLSVPYARITEKENRKPMANVNPFTPRGMALRKRARSCPSQRSQPSSEDSDDEVIQSTKKMAWKETNVLRYQEEFVELEFIGKGSFGSVYKCLNRMDGCEYAIKKSTNPLAGTFMERMALKEVYAHAVLGAHPNVVRYYSAWAECDHMLIQSEYCNMGSLADKVAREPLCAEEVHRLLTHLAEGLRYIHSHGLVHMDIKPENVFINSKKRLEYSNDVSLKEDTLEIKEGELTYKIGDLGHVTSVIDPDVDEGDCRYLPNEILHEKYDNLPKADIFACGLTVIEAAGSGPLPKNGLKWHEIRNGQVPEMRQTLTRDLIELLRLMIDRDPLRRPSATELLQHRALSSPSNQPMAQLHREMNALRFKNEILSKQLAEAAKCFKTFTPDAQQFVARFVGRKFNRSASTTTF